MCRCAEVSECPAECDALGEVARALDLRGEKVVVLEVELGPHTDKPEEFKSEETQLPWRKAYFKGLLKGYYSPGNTKKKLHKETFNQFIGNA